MYFPSTKLERPFPQRVRAGRPGADDPAPARREVVDLELRYIERLLGRRPTPDDARLLPGIDLSILLGRE